MKTTLNETNAVKNKHIEIQDSLLESQWLLIQEQKETMLIQQREIELLKSDLLDARNRYDSLYLSLIHISEPTRPY